MDMSESTTFVQIGGRHNVRISSDIIDNLNDINGNYATAQVVLSG